MTITPSFHLSQTHSTIELTVHVPHVRVVGGRSKYDHGSEGGVQCHLCPEFCGRELYFYCKPYYLHLEFPHNVIDSDGNTSSNDDISSEEMKIGSISSGNSQQIKVKYDPNVKHGTLFITLCKEIPGTHFKDLDLITRLMKVRNQTSFNKSSSTTSEKKPKIEVMEEKKSIRISDHDTNNNNEAENGNKSMNILNNSSSDEVKDGLMNIWHPKYGFANRFQNVFSSIPSELLPFEIPDPDNIPSFERTSLRIKTENDKFNVDRYLIDNVPSHFYDETNDSQEYDNYILQSALDYEPHWYSFSSNSTIDNKDSKNFLDLEMRKIEEKMQNELVLDVDKVNNIDTTFKKQEEEAKDMVKLTQDELCTLTQIPNIQLPDYLFDYKNSGKKNDKSLLFLSDSQSQNHPHENRESEISENLSFESHLCNLLDILYAYAYDCRLTNGEPTCESAWTIGILSPTLSWFETYNQYLKNDKEKTNGETPFFIHVFKNSIRRSLIYPHLRNYESLCYNAIVKKDIPQILLGGRRGILKCLLQIRDIFSFKVGGGSGGESDKYYWNNKLYIDSFCLWIQKLDDDDVFHSLRSDMLSYFSKATKESMSSLDKQHLGLNLVELEQEYFGTASNSDSESDEDSYCSSESVSDSDSESETSSSSDSTHSSSSVASVVSVSHENRIDKKEIETTKPKYVKTRKTDSTLLNF